ncbi:hypothetical protein Tsubulata_033018 [Turnera subulata]|uniref:Fe2OG dioxygenase domain-containing protein n=1 Tax=Turnera subulata TaxID=218843 RepID=A0A9Q0FGL7_9ROSI|nr:hypothetical protein Tsubulata_033018 [Turnera subulata]
MSSSSSRRFFMKFKAVEEGSNSADGSSSRNKGRRIDDDDGGGGGGVEEEGEGEGGKELIKEERRIELGEGSEVMYMRRFMGMEEGWELLEYLDSHIPWSRPTLRVFGRECVQPRDSCYLVASPHLPRLVYSGHSPVAYTWDHFPPLLRLLDKVEKAIGGGSGSVGFNSLLLNRYKGGNDYVGWHADDEKLYGPTPLIASVSLGCDRHFFLKKKNKKNNTPPPTLPDSTTHILPPPSKRLKQSSNNQYQFQYQKKMKSNNSSTNRGDQQQQYCLLLKHGSLLVMKGYTQRDWLHSVPKRANALSTRINLTFRTVLPSSS